MTQTLTPTRFDASVEYVSPLEQAKRQADVPMLASAQQLSHEDQMTLKQVLTGKYEYVKNELFDQPNAKVKIFDEAPAIARPDTSWYHPVMESVTDPRTANTTGTQLLTTPQEKALFLQFNFARKMVCDLKEKVLGKPVGLRDAREILKWHNKAMEYRSQIAQTNLALVLAMAKRTRMNEGDFGDMVSEGNMALLRAIDKFDIARGFKFSTYACRAILKAFSRNGVKLSKYRQVFPTDFDPKLEKSDFMQKKRAGHEDDCVDEVRGIMDENLAALSDIEMQVIEHRFALGRKRVADPAAEPLTLEQVGKIIGVTKERVRQIQNKAMEKMRNTLEGNFLE